jgi:glucose-1-phosphate thymidylyltransferase
VMRKAVILARGLGRRMRAVSSQAHLNPSQEAVAETGLKAMMPFKRPFLDYSLSALADAGIEEACLVIGAEHDAVRTYYAVTAPPKRIRVCFAVQAEPLGTANAVLAAEEFADGEDFLAINSDNYYPVSALRMLQSMQEPAVALFTANSLIAGGISPERISQFATCSITSHGYLAGIIEKPAAAVRNSGDRSSLISLNCWRFPQSIFDACRRTPISARGEYELPTAVEMALRDFGIHFRVVICEEPPLDLSSRTDVASVAQKLMSITANP